MRTASHNQQLVHEGAVVRLGKKICAVGHAVNRMYERELITGINDTHGLKEICNIARNGDIVKDGAKRITRHGLVEGWDVNVAVDKRHGWIVTVVAKPTAAAYLPVR